MFDTMKVARVIRNARIEKNMTQMQLADAMGVSYQAVSNWERGNSMPDISKLEDLCGALGITVQELLGMEGKQTRAVEKMVEDRDTSLDREEFLEVASVLPPEQVKEQVKRQRVDLAMLCQVAPFVDEDFLEELTEDVDVDSLLVLSDLAPFLDEDVLGELALRGPKDDFNGIAALAFFLDEDILDNLIRRCERKPEDMAFVQELAPFLEEKTLDWMVRNWADAMDGELVKYLAPFLDEDTIDALADIQISKGNAGTLSVLFPFMEEDTIRKVAKALMEQGDLEGVKAVALFL